MSTQPHAEELFPASLARLRCSPAAKPFGGGEGLRFRFGGIAERGGRLEEIGRAHV